ncbi:hypothetical protein BN971_00653 [Mycobacterium bohemicum DSM 44277]|uniref:Uncharacterized protein n=1 Tax=Mycobacterium bohemicum DSM 44277 TaxID=1236609 RepID=A0A0U0W5I8_MYCBE|nr:hypothetical protein [Mycobacterium bohemicum]MCV6968697.1 hypothetical protein [Mycobacterium bohemicum]CPR05827.1 hypothetical protein BN971_00653 [Mycobacterium bohemicum DSM 44277]
MVRASYPQLDFGGGGGVVFGGGGVVAFDGAAVVGRTPRCAPSKHAKA